MDPNQIWCAAAKIARLVLGIASNVRMASTVTKTMADLARIALLAHQGRCEAIVPATAPVSASLVKAASSRNAAKLIHILPRGVTTAPMPPTA